MEQMGDYYDISEPLLIICDNICRYHFDELVMYGWNDNNTGVWTREKMMSDRMSERMAVLFDGTPYPYATTLSAL